MIKNGKRRFRARGRVTSSWDKLRDWLADLIAPLSLRERIIYSLMVLGCLFLILAPSSRATVEDEGKLYQIAAKQCNSDQLWLSPGLSTGQPNIAFNGDRTGIDSTNAASWQNQAGALVCGNFEANNQHAIKEAAVSLSLRGSRTGALAQQDGEPTLDGGLTNFEPQRINERAEPILPNALDSSQVAQIDSFLVISTSVDNGNSWQELHTFDANILSLQEPHVSIALPDDLPISADSFLIKAEVVSSISEASLLIDALVINYRVGRADSLAFDLGPSPKDGLPALNSGNLSFKLTSKDSADGIWQGLASRVSGNSPEVNASLEVRDQENKLVTSGELNLNWQGSGLDGKHSWLAELPDDKLSIKPGRYKMTLNYTSEDGRSQSIEQDFLWGVLALNTNKTQYQVGETGLIMMSVLDELGKTVCDSELTLDITSQNTSASYSTSGRDLVPTDTCDIYGDHIQADYQQEHLFSETGTYSLNLTSETDNGSYSITDQIKVIEETPLSIERIGPTRVYPVVNYPMNFEVSSRDGFKGELREFISSDFDISESTTALPHDSVETSGSVKTIVWQLDLAPGEEATVGYVFDAPDVSPAFYLLGEAELVSETATVEFSESRQWQLAGDAVGRMLLFYAGGTIPSGWTCVSCAPGDPFYQTFVRGNTTYGGTGGSLTHTHTASGSVTATTDASTEANGSGNIDEVGHGHLFTPTLSTESNLPAYRQLRVIRANTAGEPATIPTSAIAVFDTTVPTGWTRYAAQDGSFIYGQGTVGTTGGNNSHTTTITGTTSTATGATYTSRGGGIQTTGATAGHTHTVNGTSAASDNVPPYIEVVLGELNSASAPVDGMIAMWDEDPASGWDELSSNSQPFHQRFILPNATYGTTGGFESHSHSDTIITSSVPSGTTSARQDTAGASPTHTHQVNVTNYSTVNHLPPYRDVVFAERDISAQFEQSAFRWFEGDNSTDVGAALAAQDTAADAPARGIGFRLRMNIHVSLDNLSQSGQTFKLQYAEMSGSCDINFSGESYSDVATASGGIRYFNNPTPSDGNSLTANANDPVHSGHTTRNQTYEESNNFTNSQSAINNGQDGMWDFSLVDIAAEELTTYCFRIVLSDGTPLDTYSVIPAITTDELPPRMILLYDGGSIPSGWTCISCSPGDPAYQRFIRGDTSYGTTGGSATHGHTASASVSATASAGIGRSDAGTALSAQDHGHTLTPTIDPASSLPVFRQLKIIRYENGTPATIPSGAIALFDTAVPAGWTRYSAQDGSFVRGENTAGSTGGSNTHSHAISGTLDPSTGTLYGSNGSGSQSAVAAANHTHTVSGNSDSVDNQPPFIETYLGQADSDTTVVGSMIALWDKNPNGTWTCLSCSGGDAFFERFFKPANGYGTTGGGVTHTHGNSVISTGAPSPTLTTRNQQTNVASDAHTHGVTIASYSTDNHLPPYINAIVAQAASTNTAPNTPTSLAQEKTDTSALNVGDFTNENTVIFSAAVSDTDNPDNLQLCVEVEFIGTDFDNIDTQCGSPESYTGSTITAAVTISSLTDTSNYHWQARTKDGFGATSAWVSFGGNSEAASDFSIDLTAPTGSVYDGLTASVDIDYNGGALDTISGNWDIDSAVSGLDSYEYSIGTSAGSTDVLSWTSNGTSTSFTETGLNLNTSQPYFVNVRTTDNAGSQSVISSDGQFVSPTLSFESSTSQISFGTLDSGNNYTATASTNLTTSTNARNGYVIRAYADDLLTSASSSIGMFNGGSYAAPNEWLPGDIGYGFYSSDTSIGGNNIFNGSPCAGGGDPPCYAPFATAPPGDIIADNTSNISGTPIIDEVFTINHRVTTEATQEAGIYRTVITYNVVARY